MAKVVTFFLLFVFSVFVRGNVNDVNRAVDSLLQRCEEIKHYGDLLQRDLEWRQKSAEDLSAKSKSFTNDRCIEVIKKHHDKVTQVVNDCSKKKADMYKDIDETKKYVEAIRNDESYMKDHEQEILKECVVRERDMFEKVMLAKKMSINIGSATVMLPDDNIFIYGNCL